MFWNSEDLKPRRKRGGKQETHMVLRKGNVLEIFLLGEGRGENDTANIYHKKRSYKTQNVVGTSSGHPSKASYGISGVKPLVLYRPIKFFLFTPCRRMGK
jgi:hypothetical protein